MRGRGYWLRIMMRGRGYWLRIMMRGRGYWLRIMSLGGLISTLHHVLLSERRCY